MYLFAFLSLTLSLPSVVIGATLTTLYSFEGKASDDGFPDTGVTVDAAGNLYGTTRGISPNSGGTIYEISSANNAFSTIYYFSSSSNSPSGSSPGPLMVGPNGDLYGTTIRGGVKGHGTVFEFGTVNHNLTPLHSFSGTDGDQPYGLIADGNGNFYGTTNGGGTGNYGVVYELAAGTYDYALLHSFTYSDGAYPQAKLSVDPGGNVFGITGDGGGVNASGTAFELAAGTYNLSTLYSFLSLTGNRPDGGLVMDAEGNLYGTTVYVGNGASVNTSGTVYEIASGTHTFTILHSFSGADGEVPVGGLIIDSDGNLYGTTGYGGANGDGTVFKIAAGTHAFSNLYSFSGTDGSYPTGGLAMDANGNIYGTTVFGGANGFGTVFKLTQAIPEMSSFVLTLIGSTIILFARRLLMRWSC